MKKLRILVLLATLINPIVDAKPLNSLWLWVCWQEYRNIEMSKGGLQILAGEYQGYVIAVIDLAESNNNPSITIPSSVSISDIFKAVGEFLDSSKDSLIFMDMPSYQIIPLAIKKKWP